MGQNNTFEKDLKRLSEIVSILESGEATLEDSIKFFEEGSKIAQKCEKTLKDAELKILELSEKEEDK